eukprot:6491684-Amphidinium_carterae.6
MQLRGAARRPVLKRPGGLIPRCWPKPDDKEFYEADAQQEIEQAAQPKANIETEPMAAAATSDKMAMLDAYVPSVLNIATAPAYKTEPMPRKDATTIKTLPTPAVETPMETQPAVPAALPEPVEPMRGTDNDPTFAYHKTQMANLPRRTKIEIEFNSSYNPILKDIEGYHGPVDKMEELCEDITSNTCVMWKDELVVPPYEDFYLDACRPPPMMDPTMYTGYDDMGPIRPVVFEEYWNRMIREWVTHNVNRRGTAQRRCEIMGETFIKPKLPTIPEPKMVPVEKRKLRYRLTKLCLINKEKMLSVRLGS